MAEMLGHPAWVRARSLVLAGFVALLVRPFFLRSNPTLPAATRRWTRFAVIGTVLQTVEWVLHTAAVVDHSNLVAGNTTSVMTTHLAATVVFYPIFAAIFVLGSRVGTGVAGFVGGGRRGSTSARGLCVRPGTPNGGPRLVVHTGQRGR